MTLPFTRLISVAILTAWASYAAACEVEHALAFEMKNGSHNVRLNGLLVHHGIFKNGTIPLDEGLIEGENTLSVFLHGSLWQWGRPLRAASGLQGPTR